MMPPGVTGTYATVPSAYKYFGIVKDTRPMREVKLMGLQCMAGVGAHQPKRFEGTASPTATRVSIMEGSDRCD
jgi:hypothetical protein